MRQLLAVLVIATIAACSGRGSREPAWPKRADAEVDGGESLAPRTTAVAAADEDATDDDEKPAVKADEAKPAAEAKATEEKPAVTPAATVTPEEVIQIDDIVIEIED